MKQNFLHLQVNCNLIFIAYAIEYLSFYVSLTHKLMTLTGNLLKLHSLLEILI